MAFLFFSYKRLCTVAFGIRKDNCPWTHYWICYVQITFKNIKSFVEFVFRLWNGGWRYERHGQSAGSDARGARSLSCDGFLRNLQKGGRDRTGWIVSYQPDTNYCGRYCFHRQVSFILCTRGCLVRGMGVWSGGWVSGQGDGCLVRGTGVWSGGGGEVRQDYCCSRYASYGMHSSSTVAVPTRRYEINCKLLTIIIRITWWILKRFTILLLCIFNLESRLHYHDYLSYNCSIGNNWNTNRFQTFDTGEFECGPQIAQITPLHLRNSGKF